MVSNTLFVQSLKDGERAEIAFAENSALSGLVLADGSLWIADEAQDVVWRVNPSTLEIIGGTHLDNYDSDQNDGLQLAASADSVYVSSLFGDSAVLRIGTKSDLVEARQEEGGDGTTGIAVGEGSAWAVSRFDGALWQYQERELTLVQSIALEADLSSSPRNVVAAFGSVFVLAGSGGNAQEIFGQDARPGIFRVDLNTSQVLAHVPIDSPRTMRAQGGFLWVAAAGAAYGISPADNRVTRTLTPATGKVVDVAVAQTGGGTGSTAGRPPIDVYAVVEAPALTCEELTIFSQHETRPLFSEATATLTVEGASTTFESGDCRTLRNASGEVVKYVAYFRDPATTPAHWVRVSIDGYAGDGDYDASLFWNLGDTNAYRFVAATITSNGLHAQLTGELEDVTLELDCPANADVSLEQEPPPVPAPGEAVVHTADTVLHFVNIGCSTEVLGDELSVTAPDSIIEYEAPYAFELQTDQPAEQGSLSGTLKFTYYGDQGEDEDVEVALSCGSPVTGTFQGTEYSGAFTCPL